MEKYIETLSPSLRQYPQRLCEQYKKAIEKNEKQCVIFIPWEDSTDPIESVRKASKILDPGSTITFVQDWDDEDSLKGTMVFSNKVR